MFSHRRSITVSFKTYPLDSNVINIREFHDQLELFD